MKENKELLKQADECIENMKEKLINALKRKHKGTENNFQTRL